MRTLAAATVLVASVAIGGAYFMAGTSTADRGLRATDVLSVFSTRPAIRAPDELTKVRGLGIVDFTEMRELGRNLGRFDSTVYVAPGRAGRSLCYMLHPSPGSMGIGTGYCHPLGDIPQTAKDHYSVGTPMGWTGADYHTQIYGVVFDDVTAARVRIGGGWRAVPIIGGNGLYLDLQGRSEQIDRFEVTLEDGTVQGHDIPDRSRREEPDDRSRREEPDG